MTTPDHPPVPGMLHRCRQRRRRALRRPLYALQSRIGWQARIPYSGDARTLAIFALTLSERFQALAAVSRTATLSALTGLGNEDIGGPLRGRWPSRDGRRASLAASLAARSAGRQWQNCPHRGQARPSVALSLATPSLAAGHAWPRTCATWPGDPGATHARGSSRHCDRRLDRHPEPRLAAVPAPVKNTAPRQQTMRAGPSRLTCAGHA